MATFQRVANTVSFPELESDVLRRWKEQDSFEESLRRSKGRPEFIFYDGPPFATGSPHHGTVFVSILKDVVPRYMTMRGKYVPRGWGWDCHGLPIETQAEKNLGIQEKKEIETKFGVAAFNDECRRIVSEYNDSWREYVDRIGRWVDFDHPYRTLDRDFMESVIWAFSECYKKNLIYKDYRVTAWCYRCETSLSISDTRLDDATRAITDRTVTVRFRIKGQPGLSLLAWTTTPWTLPSNLAVAVGPTVEYCVVEKDGERLILAKNALKSYAKELGDHPTIIEELIGADLVAREYRYEPLFPYFAARSDAFRVLAADFVETDEGTGVVHIAPAFGEVDYWLCREHGIKLEQPVDDQGRFMSSVKDYEGMNVHEANSPIIRRLKQEGTLFSETQVEHNYPHCWRCRTPLIYRAVDAWYLSLDPLKESLLRNNQEILWHPEGVRDGRFKNWIETARDWNISRNRFWATPIPVWECSGCSASTVLGSGAEIEAKAGHAIPDLHKEFLDGITFPCSCGGTMKRTPEVLDCWFESGSMPYGQFHYPFEHEQYFRDHFPADFIVEYTGQIRAWFYYLHVLSTALFDRPAFRDCLVHGTLLASDGKKISKSMKNYTDPLELMDRYGADSMRAYLLSSASVQMADLNFSDKGVEEILRTLMIPIWNALSFFTTYAEADGVERDALPTPEQCELTVLDRFILSELELFKERVTIGLDTYAIHEAMRLFPDFVDTLNNWYIRRSRRRVWSEDPKSPDKLAFYSTLHTVLREFTLMLAPFCPFTAEKIWEHLQNPESVHFELWPEPVESRKNSELNSQIQLVRRIVTAGLHLRQQAKIRVRQPLQRVRVALGAGLSVADYIGDIQEELNVKEVEFCPTAEIADERVVPNFQKLGRKLGQNMKTVTNLLKDGQYKRLPDGSVVAGDFQLTSDEVDIRLEGRAGFAVEGDRDMILGLDTHVTPELEREGAARDLVRAIQELRKEAKLSVSDRIELAVSGVDDLLSEYRDYVTEETLATSLTVEIVSPLAQVEVPLGDRSAKVALRPA